MPKTYRASAALLQGKRTIIPVALAIVLILAIVIGLIISEQLRTQAQNQVRMRSEHAAYSIVQVLESRFDLIHNELQQCADSFHEQSKNTQPPACMNRLLQYAPQLSFAYLTNADGKVIHASGSGLNLSQLATLDQLRELREQGSKSVLLRTINNPSDPQQAIWLLIHKINMADGAFGGVILAGTFKDRLRELLMRTKLEGDEDVSLFDSDMQLSAAYAPSLDRKIASADDAISADFSLALASDKQAGSYSQLVDGTQRTHAYLRSTRYDFTVDVGTDGTAIQAELNRQIFLMSLLAGAFVAICILLAWLVDRAWRRQQQSAVELARSERALAEAHKIANLGSYSYNLETHHWDSSETLDHIFGIDHTYPHDLEHWTLLIAEDMREEMQNYLQTIINNRQSYDLEYRIIRPCDGEERWVHGKGVLQLDAQGQPTSLVGTIQDVTEHRQAEDSLRKSEASFRNFFEENSSVMLLVDPETTKVVGANKAATHYYGFTQQDLVGMPMSSINALPAEQVAQDRQCALRGERKNFLFTHRLASGEMRDVEVFFSPIIIQGGCSLLFAIVHDITARKQMEEQVRQLAFYDPLTQLPNRRLLADRLNLALATSKRSGHYGAVMFLDLDNFKPLNDTHGHQVGDALLIEVACRLKNNVREIDSVARFGGDEFVLVIGELDQDKDKAHDKAALIAEKIRTALAKPYLLDIAQETQAPVRIEHHCASCIGVVLFMNEPQDDILKWADMAMYQAKDAGRNLIRFYTPQQ